MRKLTGDPAAYRRLGALLIEGDHLCAAWVARQRGPVLHAVVSEAGWSQPRLQKLAAEADEISVVGDEAMASVSALESPAAIVFLVALPSAEGIRPGEATVVLDAVQDPGNVGTILRSAAAFGFTQAIALAGTAALWAPKVVRAGMGAHFAMHLVEGAEAAALGALTVPLLGTSSHSAQRLDSAPLPWPCAWVLGHEGQGLSPAVAKRCAMLLRIPQPGGEESLNVASAAAVCLYESARQRGDEALDLSGGGSARSR
ncbi:MAG: RNA methyltransferase [Caldimonas sp.]